MLAGYRLVHKGVRVTISESIFERVRLVEDGSVETFVVAKATAIAVSPEFGHSIEGHKAFRHGNINKQEQRQAEDEGC